MPLRLLQYAHWPVPHPGSLLLLRVPLLLAKPPRTLLNGVLTQQGQAWCLWQHALLASLEELTGWVHWGTWPKRSALVESHQHQRRRFTTDQTMKVHHMHSQ
jgi:hypothetical protein